MVFIVTGSVIRGNGGVSSEGEEKEVEIDREKVRLKEGSY